MAFEEKQLLDKHPNYRLLFLSTQELENELTKWSRSDLINWLKWNDPNGIYTDDESLAELGNIMTHEEGVELIMKQVKG